VTDDLDDIHEAMHGLDELGLLPVGLQDLKDVVDELKAGLVEIGSTIVHHGAPPDEDTLRAIHVRRSRNDGFEPVGEQTVHPATVYMDAMEGRSLMATQITGMGRRLERESEPNDE
jgi:hypothetical protein